MVTPAQVRAREGAAVGWRKTGLALFVCAYFLYFNWDGRSAPFAIDTFMNLDYYWLHKPLWLLVSQFQIWRGHMRPMGGLFYMPLFYGFGLNPVPYHLATWAILLVNTYWLYRFARVLGCEEPAAILTALIGCYHVGLKDAYYNTSFIYDVLCFFFYFAAFLYYARIRMRGRLPGGREMAAFLALYICALNSKEMAVTLPLTLLVYEWMYHKPPGPGWRGALEWLRGPGRAAFFAGAVNLVYIYGKVHGPDAMTKQPGYGPVFSWKRFVAFQSTELSDLLPGWNHPAWPALAIIWFALIYLAWRTPRPVLRFCCIFMALAPLPIEFLEARGGACLYIPLAAWAVFASVVFLDVPRAAAAFMGREPWFRRADTRIVWALMVVAGVYWWAKTNRVREVKYVAPAMSQLGGPAPDVIRELDALRPRVRPNSLVVFLNDPFESWDMAFIADLWFRDRSIKVRLQRMTPLPPEDLAKAGYAFEFQGGKLVRVR